jgi:hypothetical protein
MTNAVKKQASDQRALRSLNNMREASAPTNATGSNDINFVT